MTRFYFSILPIFFMLCACNNSGHVEEGVKTVHFPGTDIVQQTITYANGKKNGPVKEYYKNGTLKARHFFVNDSLDDTSATYHANGRLQSLHVYKNKLKHGCWKEYNKEGRLYSQIFMKNGMLDSTSTVYTYRTGRVVTRVTYKDGVKNGPEEHFYSNGKPRSIAYYDMGRACKGTEEWMDNGKKINNDFKIQISEHNEVLMNNTLTYVIRLEPAQEGDEVYQVMTPCEGNKIGSVIPLKKKNGSYILEFTVGKGGFVMENVTLAAYRQTPFKNTYIKTTSFNASANHF